MNPLLLLSALNKGIILLLLSAAEGTIRIFKSALQPWTPSALRKASIYSVCSRLTEYVLG